MAGTTGTGPGRPLTLTAAVNLANQRIAQPTPPATAGSGPGTASTPGAPPQVPQPTPTAASIPTRMPIPKTLPEKATMMPQPVSAHGGAGPGRPTYSSAGTVGGAMAQPAVPKIPQYVHEAEGEHVLSKKKLDELVRQVCGGTADGQEGNLLTPEVEEVN
jgi:transcription initiation factor TFIID subunit 12